MIVQDRGHATTVDDETQEKFRQWLERHTDPFAIARWRQATPERVKEAAFQLVAQDPAALTRLIPANATRLADQAAAAAERIREDHPDPTSHPLAAAAFMVGNTVTTWRTSGKSNSSGSSSPPPDNTQGMAPRTQDVVAHAPVVLKVNFPQFTLKDAKTYVGAAAAMGEQGLLRLPEPMDAITTLGALRYAAWHERSLAGTQDTAPETIEAALTSVHRWTRASGKDPFDVPYEGNKGPPWRQAYALSQDSRTCAALALRFPATAGAFAPWSLAAERHAYAALALNGNVLRDLDLDQAQMLMGAVARFAEAALASPGTLAMPRFAAGTEALGLRVALGCARRVLPDGIPPRLGPFTGPSAD